MELGQKKPMRKKHCEKSVGYVSSGNHRRVNGEFWAWLCCFWWKKVTCENRRVLVCTRPNAKNGKRKWRLLVEPTWEKKRIKRWCPVAVQPSHNRTTLFGGITPRYWGLPLGASQIPLSGLLGHQVRTLLLALKNRGGWESYVALIIWGWLGVLAPWFRQPYTTHPGHLNPLPRPITQDDFAPK